jgi:hypothetical protein
MDESEEEQQEIGNKMLAAKCTHSLSGSLNDTSSMHPTSIVSIASFAQTLTQALKSTDTKLLETCFLQQHKNNKNLISNTIQRLPKKLLHTLIEQIVICLNRKKRGHGDGVTAATVRRTKTLIEWVRQILLIHMSYLLTVGSFFFFFFFHGRYVTFNYQLHLTHEPPPFSVPLADPNSCHTTYHAARITAETIKFAYQAAVIERKIRTSPESNRAQPGVEWKRGIGGTEDAKSD